VEVPVVQHELQAPVKGAAVRVVRGSGEGSTHRNGGVPMRQRPRLP